jgi:hydrogenase-4 component E
MDKHSISLLMVALLTLIVKAVMAPGFFIRLIGRHKLTFTVSSYTSMPVTLIIVALITTLANSHLMTPLTTLSPKYYAALPVMALASIFISLFVMVNRKGALSQIIGILSLENSIVAFAILSGLEQAATLQLGILFDIVVWLIIATVFISMVYRHNGSLEVTTMRHLKD